LLLSAASVWEIALKVGRGRWPDAAPVIGDIEAALREASITPLPVSVAHARAAGLLKWDHRDPFDRMLAAQAVAEGALLVTADRAFASLPLATLWD
jgi:PIN domain nuclease of toxin-antitoxin system